MKTPRYEDSLAPKPWTNGTGSAAVPGQVVNINGLMGVLHDDAADGEMGTLHVTGVFRLAKATGAGTAIAQGRPVGWDAGNSRVTKNCAEFLGTANAAATDDDAFVDVAINVGTPIFSATVTVSAAQAALNSADGQVDIDTGWGEAPRVVNVNLLTATSGRVKSAYDVTLLTAGDAGKIRVKGVASGTQVDENDVIHCFASL